MLWQHLYKNSALYTTWLESKSILTAPHFLPRIPFNSHRHLKLFVFDLSHSQFWFYSLVVKTWSLGTCFGTICAKFQLSIMLGWRAKAFLTPCNFSIAGGQIVHCLSYRTQQFQKIWKSNFCWSTPNPFVFQSTHFLFTNEWKIRKIDERTNKSSNLKVVGQFLCTFISGPNRKPNYGLY